MKLSLLVAASVAGSTVAAPIAQLSFKPPKVPSAPFSAGKKTNWLTNAASVAIITGAFNSLYTTLVNGKKDKEETAEKAAEKQEAEKQEAEKSEAKSASKDDSSSTKSD